jgi:WD40 repeat protein
MTATGHASDAITGSRSRLQTRMSFGWQLVWVLSAYLRRSDWAVLFPCARSGVRGHRDRRYVHNVAFSPDRNRIVSGSGDETLRLWPAPARAMWPKLLCAKLTANMSHRQWREWVSPDIPYTTVCPGLPVPPD